MLYKISKLGLFIEKLQMIFHDFIFRPESYVVNVREANRNGLTYKPELYSDEPLPRPIKGKDLYGVFYPNHNKQELNTKHSEKISTP